MAIKVAKLDNIFWTNGSWEKPNTTPDLSTFVLHPKLLADWNDNKTLGAIILEGDWNYAWCEGQWYFLKQVKVADRDGAWHYALIKDWWMNWLEREISITGYCVKTNNPELLIKNIDYVTPVIENPCKQYKLNLSEDISTKWWHDVEIIKPNISSETEFTAPVIQPYDWYLFMKDIKKVPCSDEITKALRTGEKKNTKYFRGVTIVGQLKPNRQTIQWKNKLLTKLLYLIDNKEDYVLSKVGDESGGLGSRAFIKNKYCLTPRDVQSIGPYEENARVLRLDFSNLFDFEHTPLIRGDTPNKPKFVKENLDFATLQGHYSSAIDESSMNWNWNKFWTLQRKTYFPYLYRNFGTYDDFLYRLDVQPELMNSLWAEDTEAVTTFAMDSTPLTPLYQGWFAQGLKSKSKPTKNFWLAYINHLNTALSFKLSPTHSYQIPTNLKENIPFYKEKNPPEFGFLMFGEVRKRNQWNWWHFTGSVSNVVKVITGLKRDWEIPENSTYDRDVTPWVERVSKWWTNFKLLNSLYPYSWLYYYTALREGKLKISYRDWEKWAGPSGWFDVPLGKEGEIDLNTKDFKALTSTNIDNNILNLDYYDSVRTKFFETKAIVESFTLPKPIYKGDIFFSDLTAYWEKWEQIDPNFRYQINESWFIDAKDNNRHKEEEEWIWRDIPKKLICYWNNETKKYHLGIYNIYKVTHKLSNEENNDIAGVRDLDYYPRDLLSYDDTITEKTINYHHIQSLRKKSTAKKTRKTEFTYNNFSRWAQKEGFQIVVQLDNLIKQAYQWYRKMNEHYRVYQSKKKFCSEFGLETPTYYMRELPKSYGEYNWWAIFDFVENFRYTLSKKSRFGNASSIKTYRQLVYSIAFLDWRYYTDDSLDITSFIFNPRTDEWLAVPSSTKIIEQIVDVIENQIKKLFINPIDWAGDYLAFNTTDEIVSALNDEGVQKDLYEALSLIDKSGTLFEDIEDIRDKLFDLQGTGYWLWIDNEEIPHLIFKDQSLKTDIETYKKTTYTIPRTETPRQDYIDAINQKTSLQVLTSTYPINERILFEEQNDYSDEDDNEKRFKISIEKYTLPNKQSVSEYYIINYQGARQLIDVNLAVPKKTLADVRSTDVVALQQLAFDRERWREEWKNRYEIFQLQKERQSAGFGFSREHLNVDYINSLFGIVSGALSGLSGGADLGISLFRAASEDAEFNRRQQLSFNAMRWGTGIGLGQIGARGLQHQREAYWRDLRNSNRALTGAAGGISGVAGSVMQLVDLNIRGRELDADIKQGMGTLALQTNQFQLEHKFQERQFAMQLRDIGNIYEQGEINERDVIDRYNKSRNLNDIHLVYKIPSAVQREGIERYYKLYGTDCQIPDVTFKFNKDLQVGQIWQFGYIENITNVDKLEEKEALKAVLSTGFKILSLRKVISRPPAEPVKAWQTQIDELLSGSNPQQRAALFNKLIKGLNTLEVIKELALNTVDKNSLVTVVTPLLDKESLMAKLYEEETPEVLTGLILKLLKRINEDVIFQKILEHKDKEKLVEEWIEGGSKLARVLWDKYPELTVSKERHDELIENKERTISEYKADLEDEAKKNLILQGAYGAQNEKLTETNRKLESEKTLTASLTRTNNQLSGEVTNLKKLNSGLTSQLNSANQKAQQANQSLTQVRELLSNKEKENSTQKKQIDSQIIEIEKLKKQLEDKKDYDEIKNKLEERKDYDDIKKKLEETEQALDAVRKIEQFDISKLPNKFALSALNTAMRSLNDYNVGVTVIFDENEKSGRYIEHSREYGYWPVEWNSKYKVFLKKQDVYMQVEMKKLWWGRWDLGFYWKFKEDSFRNSGLSAIWSSGTDSRNRLSATNSHPDSYDNAVYVGQWNVIMTSYFRYFPSINKTESEMDRYCSDYGKEWILSRSLWHTLYFHPKKGWANNSNKSSNFSGVDESEIVTIKSYGDWLNFFGWTIDIDNKKAVVKE